MYPQVHNHTDKHQLHNTPRVQQKRRSNLTFSLCATFDCLEHVCFKAKRCWAGAAPHEQKKHIAGSLSSQTGRALLSLWVGRFAKTNTTSGHGTFNLVVLFTLQISAIHISYSPDVSFPTAVTTLSVKCHKRIHGLSNPQLCTQTRIFCHVGLKTTQFHGISLFGWAK